MNPVDIIRTKRDGGKLGREQIRWFISHYTTGEVPDYQAAALLMAIVWRGMEPDELAEWALAMLESGERMDLSAITRPTVDKHSTGGVGDKISLPLAPIVAACGIADPMLSGRGLGHTGGTLDKLESIPGFDVNLDNDRFLKIVDEVGCAIVSAGAELAPADRKLYALRDVTATVESIPLIASSIMSKKIASGTEALVLDVKVGSGAFLPDIGMARELAETMVRLGEVHGVKTSALLTNMDEPLGRTAGNALEVIESIEVLEGRGTDDVVEVTLALATEMLSLAGVFADPAKAIADGSARRIWDEMVTAQGGDAGPDAIPRSSDIRTLAAPASGYVTRVDAVKGGGRCVATGGRSIGERRTG